MLAEVSEDIESYPVDGWATHGDGAIVFISLGKHRGASVVEARLMGTHGLKDLVARDKQLQAGGTPDETVLLEVEDDQEADPFGFDGPAAPTEEPAKGLDSWTDIGFGDEPGSER